MLTTVDKFEALARLEKNRAEHLVEFAAQMEAWKEQMRQYTAQVMDWAQSGGDQSNRRVEPNKPRDYQDTYDEYIIRLKSHVRNTVDLDENDFDQVWLNKFNWSHMFKATSTLYGVGQNHYEVSP